MSISILTLSLLHSACQELKHVLHLRHDLEPHIHAGLARSAG